jgi:hypothetical protein
VKKILNYPLIVFEGKNKSFILKIKHLLYLIIYYTALLTLHYQKQVIWDYMFILVIDYGWSVNTLNIWRGNIFNTVEILHMLTFIVPVFSPIVFILIGSIIAIYDLLIGIRKDIDWVREERIKQNKD